MPNVYKDTTKMCSHTMCYAGELLNKLYAEVDKIKSWGSDISWCDKYYYLGKSCELLLTDFLTGSHEIKDPSTEGDTFAMYVNYLNVNEGTQTNYCMPIDKDNPFYGCILSTDALVPEMDTVNKDYFIEGYIVKVERFDGERFPTIHVVSCHCFE